MPSRNRLQAPARARVRRRRTGRGCPAAAAVAVATVPSIATAAPPLFTEDAATPGEGELEMEAWLEGVTGLDETFSLAIAEAALGATEWLELGLAGGVGLDGESELTVPNPYGYVRALPVDGAGEGYPSVAVMALAVPPVGGGTAYADEAAVAGLVPVTFEFGDGAASAHASLGVTAEVTGDRRARPYWGAAAEVAIPRAPIVAVGEVTAGDPYDPGGPRAGAQAGALWETPGPVDVDAAVAAMADPDDDDFEWMARLGVSFGVGIFGPAAAEAP